MPNFCSSCGAKIKGDHNFCLNCGAQIKNKKDTSSFEDQVAQPQKQQAPDQTPPTPILPPQQQTGQTQAYAPMPPKKSKTGLIVGIVVIVVILVVLLAVVFMFFGGGLSAEDESDFYGTWQATIGDMLNYEMVFNSDNTLEYGISGYVVDIGTWKVSNNKLVLTIAIPGSEFSSDEYDYEFSEGGNKLTIKINDIDDWIFTKK